MNFAFGRRFVFAFVAAAVCSALVHPAQAENFPDRPIKLIVGFGAGGPTDIVARVLAEQLSENLGTSVVVENRTGASGNIATQAVASAAKDGYTFLIGASPLAVNHSLFPDFPVRFGRDIVGVAPIGASASILVVHPGLNVRSVGDFVKLGREKPGFITYATLGKGSSSHLSGVAFDQIAGTKMVPTSYRGGGEAAKDLIGGHIHAWFAPVSSVLDAVRTGKLVAIATTGPQRVKALQDVPTFVESGFPSFDVRLWVGVFAPSEIPADRMTRVERAIAAAMAKPTMQKTFDSQEITPLTMDRPAFDAFVEQEIRRWRSVVSAMEN
jgi:tripartite-type tricarboxylate transporter receptor subunit TctC